MDPVRTVLWILAVLLAPGLHAQPTQLQLRQRCRASTRAGPDAGGFSGKERGWGGQGV